MTTRDHHERMFLYDQWATRASAESLLRAPATPARAVRALAHLVATRWLWLDRIAESPQRCPVWPEWGVEESLAELQQSAAAWSAWLAGADRDELGRTVRYVNSKGEVFLNRVEEILTHVAIHGGYHRGQIATLVRQSGGEPANTDFIHAVRSGALR